MFHRAMDKIWPSASPRPAGPLWHPRPRSQLLSRRHHRFPCSHGRPRKRARHLWRPPSSDHQAIRQRREQAYASRHPRLLDCATMIHNSFINPGPVLGVGTSKATAAMLIRASTSILAACLAEGHALFFQSALNKLRYGSTTPANHLLDPHQYPSMTQACRYLA